VATVVEARPDLPPDPLPEQLRQGTPQPGRLVLEAGTFFRRDLAQRQAASLAGLRARVEQQGRGRGAEYRVVAGPFADVREADAAFAAALASGLPEARLSVE
jgi:rare lipoprotein A